MTRFLATCSLDSRGIQALRNTGETPGLAVCGTWQLAAVWLRVCALPGRHWRWGRELLFPSYNAGGSTCRNAINPTSSLPTKTSALAPHIYMPAAHGPEYHLRQERIPPVMQPGWLYFQRWAQLAQRPLAAASERWGGEVGAAAGVDALQVGLSSWGAQQSSELEYI